MKFNDLDKKQQNHVNGILSKHMDTYIRNNLVWTPEQMYNDLICKLKACHAKGEYGKKQRVNGEYIWLFKEGNLWITTDDAKELIMDRFSEKYEKNKKLARRKSPLINRARFGLKRNKEMFFDIKYGLKDECSLEKMNIVEECELIPWSIEHVEFELEQRYSTSLTRVLERLSRSSIETKFYNEWFKRYYSDKKNPALIPSFCGEKRAFYCFFNGREYTLNSDLRYKAVNVIYDFAVINFYKQKKILFVILGNNNIGQPINSSIKQAIANDFEWELKFINADEINRNINSLFEIIDKFFEK